MIKIKEFFLSFLDRFSRDKTTTLASSLAFYTSFSFAPLLVLFITISSRLSDEVQKTFLSQVETNIGADAASAFQLVISNAKDRPDLASASGIISALTLLLSASLIFAELRNALNQIFRTPLPPEKSDSWLNGIWKFVKGKILTATLALGFIFLMIFTLTASSLITAAFSEQKQLWFILNLIGSFLFFVLLFTFLFHFIPARKIRWKRAFQGGAITALLFVIGKELIAVYLGRSAVGSAYGAAGSIILLLVWVYYSALITFIGAHISSLLLWKESHS